MILKYIWRSFSLGCHFHVHFSYPWHAFASHGLPAIAELLVHGVKEQLKEDRRIPELVTCKHCWWRCSVQWAEQLLVEDHLHAVKLCTACLYNIQSHRHLPITATQSVARAKNVNIQSFETGRMQNLWKSYAWLSGKLKYRNDVMRKRLLFRLYTLH